MTCNSTQLKQTHRQDEERQGLNLLDADNLDALASLFLSRLLNHKSDCHMVSACHTETLQFCKCLLISILNSLEPIKRNYCSCNSFDWCTFLHGCFG